MSFQWIIDNAESIIVDTKPVVASTQTRDGTVRSVSRGGSVWRFTVTLPDGPRWSEYRSDIAEAQAIGRVGNDTINFSNAGLDWLFGYQGDYSTIPTNLAATVNTGDTTITISRPFESDINFIFKSGDLIQLDGKSVYRIEEDVAFDSNESDAVLKIHRPYIDSSISGNVPVNIGADCNFKIKCVEFPDFNIFARDQVGWTGSFVFVEDIT